MLLPKNILEVVLKMHLLNFVFSSNNVFNNKYGIKMEITNHCNTSVHTHFPLYLKLQGCFHLKQFFLWQISDAAWNQTICE